MGQHDLRRTELLYAQTAARGMSATLYRPSVLLFNQPTHFQPVIITNTPAELWTISTPYHFTEQYPLQDVREEGQMYVSPKVDAMQAK